jgi:hypothetical protein
MRCLVEGRTGRASLQAFDAVLLRLRLRVASPCGAAWAKLARALYIVSPAVTMSADARNRLCGVYHTAFIRSSLEIRISVREVETLASFIHRTPPQSVSVLRTPTHCGVSEI